MDIVKKNENGAVQFEITGRLDTSTAPDLEDKLTQVIPNASGLILDFKGLDYISSAGLRVLLGAKKQMNAKSGKMIIRNVNETVMDVFNVTGFSEIMTIE